MQLDVVPFRNKRLRDAKRGVPAIEPGVRLYAIRNKEARSYFVYSYMDSETAGIVANRLMADARVRASYWEFNCRSDTNSTVATALDLRDKTITANPQLKGPPLP